ncbi:uncharacterized protein TNCV_387161 [Trichonephila clavipes]|nr:uncharacterized protein TNCV_387161 [Trichonephila clavipes]
MSELAPPLLTTTPLQREDVSALDRLNVHHCPTRRVFCGTGLEFLTRPATIRYLDNSGMAEAIEPISAETSGTTDADPVMKMNSVKDIKNRYPVENLSIGLTKVLGSSTTYNEKHMREKL